MPTRKPKTLTSVTLDPGMIQLALMITLVCCVVTPSKLGQDCATWLHNPNAAYPPGNVTMGSGSEATVAVSAAMVHCTNSGLRQTADSPKSSVCPEHHALCPFADC